MVIDDLNSAEENLLGSLQEKLPKLQRAVYLGNINDKTNVLGKFILLSSLQLVTVCTNEFNQLIAKTNEQINIELGRRI